MGADKARVVLQDERVKLMAVLVRHLQKNLDRLLPEMAKLPEDCAVSPT